MQRSIALSPIRFLAAALLLAAVTALAAPPAQASQDEVRIDIDVLDLAGQDVAGVDLTVTTASGLSLTVTTDAWGGARVRFEIPEGDSITVTPAIATREGPWSVADAGPGDRYDAEFTSPVAQGFEVVSTVRDVTGDGVPETVWHRANAGAHDDWLTLGSDGVLYDARFGYGHVAYAGITRIDTVDGSEVVALEEVPGGYRLWTWNPITGDEERTDLGSIPSLDFLENDMDGDGTTDLLFYGGEPGPDGFDFTVAFGDGDVSHFSLGGPDSYFFPELVDVTGDHLPDVFVAAAIPGTTIRWHVWESDNQSVHTADLGTHGETVVDGVVLDGDGDGLAEFLGAFYVDGVNRGWEVLEYATGDQFQVILGPEDDRGPGTNDYPASWFTP